MCQPIEALPRYALISLLAWLCTSWGVQDVRYDVDGDGVEDRIDCAPDDPAVWGGAPDQVGDGIDNDCDGVDGRDRDGDGFASVASGGDDCNDAEAAVHPGAPEVADDGVDNDCLDGDLLCDADGDGDDGPQCGGPDCDDHSAACSEDCTDGDGDGRPACAGDCDDADAEIHPLADERCNGLDDDCDGALLAAELDLDGDSSFACDLEPDCDDDDPLRFPANPELCDGVDNDCDAATAADGGEQDADGDGVLACGDCADDDPALHPLDSDGDGISSCDGDCNDDSELFRPGAPDWAGDGADTDCDGTPGVDLDEDGYASEDSGGTDCDDDDAAIHTDVVEVCDGVDQDCDGVVDDGFDLDGDGATICAGDCDDDDGTRFPGAVELCDGLDNDCDGGVPTDEADIDLDGFPACMDCDDAEAAVHPSATESCNAGDDDCDGLVDEGFDVDGDGVTSCAGDCDDDNALLRPSEPEVCDGADTDCDPSTTVAGGETDDDGDGHVPCSGFVDHGVVGSGGVLVFAGGDCDDAFSTVLPGGYEYCDGLDNDCDPSTSAVWGEEDADADGHVACASFLDHGVLGAGGQPLVGGGDCDDDNPHRNAGAAEVCDGWDNDCDLEAPDEVDDDEDRFLPCSGWVDHGALNPAALPLLGGGDCEEQQPHRFPGNPEVCDGLDNDCDAATDSTWDEDDGDGDGWVGCEDYVDHGGLDLAGAPFAGGDDCDDDDPASNPALEALWEDPGDGADTGCDGFDGNGLGSTAVDRTLYGTSASAGLGTGLASAGDVDGDGLEDLLVGVPYSSSSSTTGRVHLLLGADLAAGPLTVDDAHITWTSESDQDNAGERVAGVGDVDGDGLDDVLIGVRENDEAANRAGKSYLVLGASMAVGGERSLASAAVVFLGEGSNDLSGAGVAGAGDVDGDGLDDILIGVVSDDEAANGAGKACLFTGATIASGTSFSTADADAAVLGESAYNGIGDALAGIGDVDGDGFDDIALAADSFVGPAPTTGRVYVVLGAQLAAGGTMSLADAHAKFDGQEQGVSAGGQLSAAGDVDGDSVADLLVGAGSQNAGRAWLISGAVAAAGGASSIEDSWAILTEEEPMDWLGSGIAAGDVDGDGLGDLFLGASASDEGGNSAGKAFLVLGASLAGGTFGLDNADLALVGQLAISYAGQTVAVADIDGDGLDDLVVGAPWNSVVDGMAGATYVLFSQY